jgi:MOSC domain-containing protein
VHLAQLWRYPVKSLKGEALRSADLTPDGIAGDRVVHVAGRRGLLTGRTRHDLLRLQAATGQDGVPTVDGRLWHSEEAADLVRLTAGPDARLVADTSPERFDILNLLVATDGAVELLGADVRRLRPNLVLAGVPAEQEPLLPGHAIAIGDAVIGLHSMRQRCIVTTIDPDDGAQDLDVLRRIRAVFSGEVALNAWVIRPGVVEIGDRVRVIPSPQQPSHIGGWIVGAPYQPHPAG